MASMDEVRAKIVAAVKEPREGEYEAFAAGSLIFAFNQMVPEHMKIETPAWLEDMRKPS